MGEGGAERTDDRPDAAHRRIEVAAAVIFSPGGEFLLAQRPEGKVYSGYWEFPGGKLEPGESVAQAVRRELHEELGIDAREVLPWITREFTYPHAAVRLRFCRIPAWTGELHGKEGQRFAWQRVGALTVSPVLPANGPVLRALELPSLYGITCAHAIGREAFLARLEHALAKGLRLIQVREKSLEHTALREFARAVIARAHAAGARVLINSDVALAEALGADGVHLTGAQLAACASRPNVAWCAASCHDAGDLSRAADLGLDFVVLGPVLATPSHPASPEMGWARFAQCVRDCPLPVYALGGMQRMDLGAAQRHGAQGVAMMRGAWL